MGTTASLIVFGILAAVAVITAVLMLVSRHAVYSALFLVLNFATIAVLFLLLKAPFIAFIQVTVYAGAIMVLFLFVIMLLGLGRVEEMPSLPALGPIAALLGVLLVGLLGYTLFSTFSPGTALSAGIGPSFGSPAEVGHLLFNRYLVPFEVTSLLLLVAMVGAIFLSTTSRKEPK